MHVFLLWVVWSVPNPWKKERKKEKSALSVSRQDSVGFLQDPPSFVSVYKPWRKTRGTENSRTKLKMTWGRIPEHGNRAPHNPEHTKQLPRPTVSRRPQSRQRGHPRSCRWLQSEAVGRKSHFHVVFKIFNKCFESRRAWDEGILLEVEKGGRIMEV